MSAISVISPLSALINYNKVTTPTPVQTPKSGKTADAIAAAEQAKQNSALALASSNAPAGYSQYGAQAPSSFYNNISTLSTLDTINQINALKLTQGGTAFLPLGTAAQAAAAGKAYQSYNAARLFYNTASILVG